jgi:hypothetical protein
MRYFIGIAILLVTISSNAAVKQLSCNIKHSSYENVRNFIFDTDDFAKENPEADTILVETSRDKNEIWVDVDVAKRLGGNVTTFTQAMGIGKTYRTNFEVTPTFLTFMYVDSPECRSATGLSNICNDIPVSMSISRKTLTGQNNEYRPPLTFSCELSDYSTEDNLL